jgi:beta-lactamase regulating signal transducer with metallopeptidase domain
MNGPYVLRLLYLCLASFFAVNASVGMMAALASRAAIRFAGTLQPRAAARFLFAVRLLPFGFAAAVVIGLCVPSYLWLEPQLNSERIGSACFLLALCGIAGWFGSIARVERAVTVSLRFRRSCQKAGGEMRMPGDFFRAMVIRENAPLLAVAGVFRPRLLISERVLQGLPTDQLEVALQHEYAHLRSRDNFKRLLMLLAPRPFPFLRSLSSIEADWVKLSEWAADDEAVQGDPIRALALAEALLGVVRLGSAPRLSFLHTSLVGADRELSARVERLLHLELVHEQPIPRAKFLPPGPALGVALATAMVLAWPATLPSVHRLLEIFLR